MNKIILVAALLSVAALTQCSRSTDNKVEETQEEIVEDIKKEKAEVAQDLRELRDDINNRLDKISKRLEKENIDAREDLNNVRERLTVQRDKVEKALDEINNSSDETWDDIQQASRNTAAEIKLEFQKLGERIDLALEDDRDNTDEPNDNENK
jgi:predicted  nucleic acid-binding Zn-ribbon protein